MNTLFFKKYIQNLTKNDIQTLATKKNILLNSNELQDTYNYIKNNYQKYFNQEISKETILNDFKKILTNQNYEKIYKLYKEHKDKI